MSMTHQQMRAVGTEYVGVGFTTFVGGERMVIIKFVLPKMEFSDGEQVDAFWYFLNRVLPHGVASTGHVYWAGRTMCGEYKDDKVTFEFSTAVEFRHFHSFKCIRMAIHRLYQLIKQKAPN